MQDTRQNIDQLVRTALADWIEAGRGDECFWEPWGECPTEIDLTPNMVLVALNQQETDNIAQQNASMAENHKRDPSSQRSP